MTKMSIEEKAKAYDKALEAARKELGVDRKEWEVVQRVLHNIFPELRESEDERIRKEIIDYLGLVGKGKGDYAQQMIDRWIAYLEKQKEQKPVEWSEEDEKLLNYAISMTDDAQVKNFLKSLCPSWKPDEEQMRCFDMVLCDEAMDENVHRVLVQLREQLKRLM